MIFKKLVLQNIRSCENLEIEFPKGSVLLSGDIGAGKTSILLGLQFALFGLQPGQKGNSILRQGEEEAYVSLEIDIDGQVVFLERKIKKSKSGGITQDSNIITIGTIREELSTLEMKDRVIELLSYPKQFVKKSNLLYKFTVYTPQEEMKDIIQERSEVRLDTLRHIFGIDRYKRIKDNATIFVQKIKESVKVKEILVSELNLLREKFVIENERKIALAKEVNNLKIEYQNLIEKKNQVEEKLSSNQKLMDDKKEILSNISRIDVELQGKSNLESKMKKDMSMMQKQVNKNIDFSNERLAEVSNLLDKHKKILDEKNDKLVKIISDISVLNSKKEISLKMKNDVMSLENCPTCFQSVGEEHKYNISKRVNFELEDINRELENKLLAKEEYMNEIEKEKKLVNGYEYDKNNLQQNKIKYEHQLEIKTRLKSDAYILDRISNEIIELRTRKTRLGDEMQSLPDIEIMFEEDKKEFQSVNEVVRSKEILSATKSKELDILRSRLEEISLEISNKEKIREDLNLLRRLQDWIQDKFVSMINMTEKKVMVKLRREFSNIFSEWFAMLVGDSLSVRLDEDFTPVVTNQDYEIDYDFLSGGERTAIALAYRLSLNQVLNSMLSQIKTKDVLILDEPTDGFSTEQIDKMRDIFDQLKAEQMILVSHEEKISGFVDHVIKVKKDKVTKIE